MGKPLSWKWKLTIGLVICLLFLMAAMFSPWGQDMFERRIRSAYEELPATERRESAWADSWINLAWWRSSILQDSKAGMRMYREFCGLPYDPSDMKWYQEFKLQPGLCSEDGLNGWGPAHPRAPEAYVAFLKLYKPNNSSQFTREQCANFYRLFYTWMQVKLRKPHPKFREYWEEVKYIESSLPTRGQWPKDVNVAAPLAPPLPKSEEKK